MDVKIRNPTEAENFIKIVFSKTKILKGGEKI